jgi:hypothetical protein
MASACEPVEPRVLFAEKTDGLKSCDTLALIKKILRYFLRYFYLTKNLHNASCTYFCSIIKGSFGPLAMRIRVRVDILKMCPKKNNEFVLYTGQKITALHKM